MTRHRDSRTKTVPADPAEFSNDPLFAFAPVPRRARRDGWTPARQRAFIAALAESGNVTAASEAVGMTFNGAYQLRRQPGAEGFAAAWHAALTPETAPPPPEPAPLTLRGLMHVLEAQRRRHSAAGEEEVDVGILETFEPVPASEGE